MIRTKIIQITNSDYCSVLFSPIIIIIITNFFLKLKKKQTQNRIEFNKQQQTTTTISCYIVKPDEEKRITLREYHLTLELLFHTHRERVKTISSYTQSKKYKK